MSVPMHRLSTVASRSDPPAAHSRSRLTTNHLVLMGCLSGAFTALCWLPLGFSFLMPLAMVPAMRALRLLSRPRDAILFGIGFETALHAVGAHYILALLKFTWFAPLLLALDIGYQLPFAAATAWGAFWIGRRAAFPPSFAFVLIYSAMEWVRTKGALSNCADLMTHAFGTHPQWLAWTPWTGPYAMSLLAFGVAALFEASMAGGSRGRAAGTALAGVLLWLGPPATDLFFMAAPATSSASLRVGIVQPSFSPEEKLDRKRWPESWDRLTRLTREAARGADLVIWPESTRPGYAFWTETEPFSDPPVQSLAREVNVPILYGCVIARASQDRVVALYNGAALVRPDGTPGEWYAKQQLLPFVEGVPFARLIGWDPAEARRGTQARTSFLTLAGNFSPGSRPTIFRVGPARIGVLICYEDFYPQLVRRYRLEGANALCIMTNDAWFGRTIFASTHAWLVAARAREAGVPVVRAANSGVSSAMDRFGRRTDASTVFDVTTLSVPLGPASSEPTIYSRAGDLLTAAEIAALAFLVARGLRRSLPANTSARAAPLGKDPALA